jgi:hypothetical protein
MMIAQAISKGLVEDAHADLKRKLPGEFVLGYQN